MATPNSTPLVGVQKVDVENVNLSVPGKDSSAQKWIALTPLLSLLITALTLLSSSILQFYQGHSGSMQKEDSDWRSALEKVSLEQNSAAIGTFEMQSFLGTRRHRDQARSIATALMPNIVDKYEFDAAFFVLLEKTDQNNQNDILSIARSISNDLRELHQNATRANGCRLVNDCSLSMFVMQPEQFLDSETQANELRQALTDAWKLESVCSGLSSIWGTKGSRTSVEPKKSDLSGIIFLNNDYSGVDFREASMQDTEFIGKCSVDKDKLPRGFLSNCAGK